MTIPNGSLIWKMGQMWNILSPNSDGNYSKENIKHSPLIPEGITDIPTGKGSMKRSLQIVGKPLCDTDNELDMGWVKIRISIINGQANIEMKGGSEAATKRWAMPLYQRKPEDTLPQPDLNIKPFTKSVREQRIHDQAHWEWLRSEVYIRDKGICWICNEFVTLRDYDLGHLIDRANGGNDTLENCAVMHKSCNIKKPRHKSIAEASTWRLTPKVLHTPSKLKPKATEQLSFIPNSIS